MTDSPDVIRSYQRIFRPDRRIYQVDGHRLPVPGGVSLQWLAWAAGTLLIILVLGTRSLALSLMAAVIGAVLGGESRGWRGALLLGALAALAVQIAGVVLGWLDWPLRLVVLPVLIATASGQLNPDGRSGHRYLLSRLLVNVRAARRSLGRPVMADGQGLQWAPRVWVAPDDRFPALHHGRVSGPARLVFASEVVLTPRRGRHIVRPSEGHRMRKGERTAQVIELLEGQAVEIRP